MLVVGHIFVLNVLAHTFVCFTSLEVQELATRM